MQNYQEKPIPLVIRQPDAKYTVNPEALELFLSVEGKLAIISVAGVYRTGKSYLLNKMLLNRKAGFAVGPTVNPQTKGIWVWGKPLIFKNQENQIINVLIIDSEGLGSTEEDINHDLRLFSITLLLSSSFMYNTVGAIDENALDSLGLVLRLCEHLKSQNFNDFPDFNWVLRDFSLALLDKNGSPLTPNEYLQLCLNPQTGDSEVRNKIRDSIKRAFHNRNCYAFVRPLIDQASLQNLDDMELEQLRPQFVEQVIDFRKMIYSNLKVKSIKGREIKGAMLCDLIKIYVDCINSDKLPVIESGWEQLCLKEVHQLMEEIEEAVAKRVRELKEKLPRTKKQLMAEQESLMEQFQQIFRQRLKNNHKANDYFVSIQELIHKELKGVEQEMKTINAQETQSFVKKEFENIEKRLKNNEFKNMGQLVKEFEIFYEYYRKKCPYKDDIQTGLQFMLKKFSDSSLIMYKAMQHKKDANIEQLNNQIIKVNADFTLKEEKLKSDRAKLQDKVAKLETNLEKVQKQNLEMIKTIEELEAKLEEAENQSGGSNEANLERDNLELRRQIMSLQQKEKDLICNQSSELNALNQNIMLKQNEIENYRKLNEELSLRLQANQLAYAADKEESALRLADLSKELENTTHEKLVIEKSLKDKLAERERELQQLENAFESKCEELNDLTNKTFLESSMISEQVLFEERKSLDEKTKENEALKQELKQVTKELEARIKKLETDLNESETSSKIMKLQLEQQKALLAQKIEFIERESSEKNQKLKALQQQINSYVSLFEQKDEQIQDLINELDEYRTFGEAESEEIQKKIKELTTQLEQKNQLITKYENQTEKLESDNRKYQDSTSFKIKQLQALNEKYDEAMKKMEKELEDTRQQNQEMQAHADDTLETLRQEHNRDREDQKRNAELSLVQLKNFYEMEKERLQKRILEERKRFEYNETNKVMEMTNQHAKQIKQLTDSNNELTQKLQDIEEEMLKSQNQFEVKILGLEEQLESERKSYENRYEILKKKYEELSEEIEQIQKQNEQDRINFVKKIEGLNFQISKRQKEISHLNVKKETLEATIAKKDSQLEAQKKTMHQEIEESLKKVSEFQAKANKINEQYFNYKIEAEKENALSKQRNEFLAARLADVNKEKESGSLKNIEKMDRQKISQLKEQLEKVKSENISLEAKIENLRKNEKQSMNNHKKEVSQLQKDNMYFQQKNELSETKIKELQAKITVKNNTFIKQIEEIRIKHQQQRLKLQADVDSLKQKLSAVQDQKNKLCWDYQKEMALISDRIKFAEEQRDQSKKELQQTEKRLNTTINQMRKSGQRGLDESGIGKRQSLDKRYSNQMEIMKMSSKVRQQELEESNKKIKDELKACKQKLVEYEDKIAKAQKSLIQEKNLSEQVQRLKRQKEHLIMVHRNQIVRETDEFKKKYAEAEKKNREVERKNNEFIFVLEREKARHNLEKQNLVEKIKQLEDTLVWERKKAEPKNKTEASKSKRFSVTTSNFMDWK